MPLMDRSALIYVAGHSGMVGSAVVRRLTQLGYTNLLLPSHRELDLTEQEQVRSFMRRHSPQYVFFFAARVGGIKANIAQPVEFLLDNLMMEANLIRASFDSKVKKLLYLGSSCIYPRECPQPMKEEYLLTGRLEPTNEGYALAKIAGMKLCEYYNRQYKTNYLCLMPPNLYGPDDNFSLETSHVVAALIRRFTEASAAEAPSIEVWGSGAARREFLYVDDLADACIHFMNNWEAADLPAFVNVGAGSDVSIRELVELIRENTGFRGQVLWNTSMPDGMPRKFLDSGLLQRFGWQASISLAEGISRTVEWYRRKQDGARA